MKVLVTGGGGQVAEALRSCVPDGTDCVVLPRSGCDLADSASIDSAVCSTSPDVIINCAAFTAVDRAEDEPELAERVNSLGVADLAAAATARGARLVQISTDFVFDGALSRPYRPDDSTHPLSVYGRSKLGGERAALAAEGALVVRTAWVYRAGGANFVETMLRLMAERDRLAVVSDQIGTPTHANSLAQAIWKLVSFNVSGIHHFTDAGVASWYDFAVAIHEEGRALGLLQRDVDVLPLRSADYPQSAMRPAYSVLDKTATWPVLGAPANHWRVELRRMLIERKEQGIG